MKSYIVVALVAMFCLGLNLAMAQPTQQADILLQVTVGENPLTLTVNAPMDVAGLTAGQDFAFVPDGAGSYLVPANPGAVVPPIINSAADVSISGDPNATVLVSFALPSVLYPSVGPGLVHISFNGTSAIWGLAGAMTNYFDPRVPTQIVLDPTGVGTSVDLGGIVSVAANSVADVYTGDAIMTVSYVGN